jgi:DNA polymerase-3 subunit alpha
MTTVELTLKNMDEFDLKTLLDFEKDTLGFYVSGHPLDNFRDQIDAINYTLSSEVENIEDGSTAIFIGKVETITKKMSKKGSQFGLVSLMDFHGNIEVMLFSDKLEELEKMDLDEPIAFKVKVTHTEMFTRISVSKIMTLAEAKKEAKKVETKIVEAPQEPLLLRIRLSENLESLEKLYTLVRRHPGRRPIKLTIVSKLCDVVIDSAIRVDNKVIEELATLEDVDVI